MNRKITSVFRNETLRDTSQLFLKKHQAWRKTEKNEEYDQGTAIRAFIGLQPNYSNPSQPSRIHSALPHPRNCLL
jgi:hypothetical protein